MKKQFFYKYTFNRYLPYFKLIILLYLQATRDFSTVTPILIYSFTYCIL